MSAQDCPTPEKVRFATTEAAAKSGARFIAAGRLLSPYECVCGWFHLTKRAAPPVPVDDPLVTGLVVAMSDEEFALLVGADVRGGVSPAQAGALRSAVVVTRWQEALKALEVDLNGQLAERAGDRSVEASDWRRRTERVRLVVRERRVEVARIRQALGSAAEVERLRLAAAGLSVREARAAAGEVAQRRLVAAHAAEFGLLLAEEFERAGLVVPARVARHVARNRAEAQR